MSALEIFSLLGGVGLFLYGMTVMSTGLKNAAGDKMRDILEHATANKAIAILVGIAVTVLIQSSSATDMMVIGFVNSGLMTLSQAIGVIMGANIGTTITAQITAFNLTAYAPLILFLGAVLALFTKRPLVKHIGSIIMGFGMLFVGIGTIKTAIAPLSESAEFVAFLAQLSNPLLAVLFGVAFTALLQSSSSSVVIFQAFAVQGLLSYEITVYLAIGAAIGSVTPNILASLTTDRNGKRTAVLNLLFNLFRALFLCLLIGLFPQVLTLIQSLSPGDVGRQVANTHTLFALLAVLVELPFADQIVKLSQVLIPVLPEETRAQEERRLVYMVDAEKMVPSVAIKQAILEIIRMGKIARNNLQASVDCFFSLDPELAEQVEETEATVDFLCHAITDKLVELRSLELSERDINCVSKLTLIAADLERIGDHAENIIEYEAQVQEKKAELSELALQELKELADASISTIDLCLEIFAGAKWSLLPQAEQLEQNVDDLQKRIIANHVSRLINSACDPMGGVVFSDMSTDLERCSDHAINIATSLAPAAALRAMK